LRRVAVNETRRNKKQMSLEYTGKELCCSEVLDVRCYPASGICLRTVQAVKSWWGETPSLCLPEDKHPVKFQTWRLVNDWVM